MKSPSAFAAFAFALAALACSPSAAAVEREHHVGIDAGYAMLVIGDKSTPDVGAGVGLHWTYGLSDAFNLMVEGSWSLLAIGEKAQDASTPRTRPASITNADVGIAYVFDVLQWVPWVAVLGGGYAFTGGTIDGAKILPGAAVGLGLDYRLSRSWVVGGSARQHFFLQASRYPSFTQVFAQFEYTWGW
jgi:hypothetical protein